MCHKRGSGSVRPETVAETTEVRKHGSSTRIQKSEQRRQAEDEGSKGRVDWGAVQALGEGNDVRKQPRGLQRPQGFHQDPAAEVSSNRRQQWKQPDGRRSCSKPVDEYFSSFYNYEFHPDSSLFQSNQTPTPEINQTPPQEAERLPVLSLCGCESAR